MKKFWNDMAKRVGLKTADKLMVGNSETQEAEYIDLAELFAIFSTDDLPESDTKKYISVAELQKLVNLPDNPLTAQGGAQLFYPLKNNPEGYLNAESLLNTAKLDGAVIAVRLIPNLDAEKIVSGILNIARIPNLDAQKITSGTIAADRLPNIPLNKISELAAELNKYILAEKRGNANGVAPLDADKKIGEAYLPGLDASKITSGVIDDARLPDWIANSSALASLATVVASLSGLRKIGSFLVDTSNNDDKNAVEPGNLFFGIKDETLYVGTAKAAPIEDVETSALIEENVTLYINTQKPI